MTAEMLALYGLAVTIAFTHTILGPDHYLPFIAMSRAGHWTMRKTIIVTVLCGLAHVLSSVLIGLVGIVFGVSVLKLENIESSRGDLTGWMLIGFGLAYTVWGVRRAVKTRTTLQGHPPATSNSSLTTWILFTIFLFGPCEPLIPLLMYPAALGGWLHVATVALIFGVTTVGTMLGVVYLTRRRITPNTHIDAPSQLGRFAHAAGGLVMLSCGIAVKFGL